jgi:tetratricopeptide (TPR) repeat protein
MNTNISLKLDELKHLNEWYFGVDKDSKISTLHTDIENQTSPDDVYVLGILLNCSDKYESMAEKYLTKFVKLHPFSMEGWIELGSCLWKKGNLSISWKCYEKSISLQENKIAYRDMSMLCRQMNDKKDGGYVLQSVELAHKAVKLDVADHKSWYCMYSNYTVL